MIKVFNQKPHLLGWLCFALAIIAYANTFTHDYVWDDALVMTENAYTTQGLAGIDDIWTKRVYLHNRSVYRPIPQTIFALEYAFFSDNPSVSHIVNVLFYAFTCFLLFYFLRQLFSQSSIWLLFFITLLYTLHPLHTEVVANIKSLDEILAMFFGLISLISVVQVMKSKELWKWAVIFVLSFIAAILSKVSAITLLPVFVLVAYYKSDFDSIFSFLLAPVKWIRKTITSLWRITFSQNYFSLNRLTILFSIILVAISIYSVFSFSSILATFSIAFLLFLQFKTDHYYYRVVVAFFILIVAYVMGWLPFLYIYFLIVSVLLFEKKNVFFFVFALLFFYFNVKLNNGIATKALSIIPFLVGVFYTEKRKWLLFIFPFLFVLLFFIKGFQIELSLLFASFFSALFFFKQMEKKWKTIGGLALIFSTLLFANIKIDYSSISAVLNSDIYQGGTPSLTPAHNEDWTVEISILNNSLLDDSPTEKYATIAKIQGIYLQKLFFPHPLVHQYGFNQVPSSTFTDWRVWLSIIIHLGLINLALYTLQQKNKIAFGIIFYISTASIYTNIVLLMPDTMAERFMFMPSFGFCIALIFSIDFLLQKIKWKQLILTLLVIPIAGFFMYKTIDRNFDWKNGYTLAVNTIEYAPENATLLAQYGTQLNIAALKDYDIINPAQDAEIERSLKHAIELFPGFYSAQTDLATFYSRHERDEEAFPCFVQAIELAPTDWINHYYIGFIYNKKGEFSKAIYHLGEALSLNEGAMLEGENVLAEGVMARAYFKTGEVEKSILLLEYSYKKYANKDTYITLANQYQEMGDLQKMLTTLVTLQQDFPEDTELNKTIELVKSLTQ